MYRIIPPLVICLAAVADEKPTPKVPIGKDTTYVTGPLDKNGFIDYEAALSERLGKGVKPETNANVLLWKALGPRPEGGNGMPPDYFKHLGIAEPPEKGDYLINLGAYRSRVKLVQEEWEDLIEQQSRAGARPWKAVDMPHITAWLALNEKPLAVVVEACKRPHYFNPLVSRKSDKELGGIITALLPNVQKCRELASALTARAMQRLGEGKVEEAWQDLLTCHRLARHVGNGATLIESLVGIAIDAIASNADLAFLDSGKLSHQQIRKCMKDLQELPPLPRMADKIDLGGRFMYLDCVQLVRRGGGKMFRGFAELPFPEDNEKFEKALAMIDWTPAMRTGNQWYDRLSQALRRKERAERERELDGIEEDLKKLKTDGAKVVKLLEEGPPNVAVGKAIADVLVHMLMPAARKVQNAADRAEQIHRNLQVAFALAAYHKVNGKYPQKLDDLAPKFLAAVPIDIFSAKALIYRLGEKGYLLYSVGVNGKDEEGRWYDDDPPGDDPRVRMPLPELKTRR